MAENKEQAAEQAMAKLQEAADNLKLVRVAIEEAYSLMLENGLGLSENRVEIRQATIDAMNLGCLIHPTLIRGL